MSDGSIRASVTIGAKAAMAFVRKLWRDVESLLEANTMIPAGTQAYTTFISPASRVLWTKASRSALVSAVIRMPTGACALSWLLAKNANRKSSRNGLGMWSFMRVNFAPIIANPYGIQWPAYGHGSRLIPDECLKGSDEIWSYAGPMLIEP